MSKAYFKFIMSRTSLLWVITNMCKVLRLKHEEGFLLTVPERAQTILCLPTIFFLLMKVKKSKVLHAVKIVCRAIKTVRLNQLGTIM